MTPPVKAAPLKGGPMEGTDFRPVSRWPSYLSASGAPILSTQGDRIVSGRSVDKACYVLVKSPMTGEKTYEYREAKS
jgi:hypothetical protein